MLAGDALKMDVPCVYPAGLVDHYARARRPLLDPLLNAGAR